MVPTSCCDPIHEAHGHAANGGLQVGGLPPTMQVRGTVAWYVFRGPNRDLGEKGWGASWREFTAKGPEMTGVPGDRHACSPEWHEADHQGRMLTILWAPVKGAGTSPRAGRRPSGHQ